MPEPRAKVRSASDPEQVKQATKDERLQRDNELADVKSVMELPAGRRFLWRLLGQTDVFKSIFVTSSEIYYRAGQQDVGHWLMREIDTASPKLYLLMQQEAAKLIDATVEPSPPTVEE